MLINLRHQLLIFALSYLSVISTVYAVDDSLQLKLERAGRLLASTYVIGNPDEKLYGLHPDYKPSRPREMIHNDIEISIVTKHSIQETKGKVVKIKGLKQFEQWVFDVRKNFRFSENLNARTMGVCIDGCCRYPIDGGMSHNSLYLKEACFVIKNKTPFLKSIVLLDGD
jgi:hypothetical protein